MQRARQGDVGARKALKLANNPSDFLSTVQIGITLIGILSGAVGGATLAQTLELRLQRLPALAPYSELLSLLAVVGSITFLSLVVGELAPKRLALNRPEPIASVVARPMGCLARLASPLVRLLSLTTDGLLRLLGQSQLEDPGVTEEEIKVLIDQGTQTGTFEASEQAMVNRIFSTGGPTDQSVYDTAPGYGMAKY